MSYNYASCVSRLLSSLEGIRRANQNASDNVLFKVLSTIDKESGVMHHIRLTAEYNTFDVRAT